MKRISLASWIFIGMAAGAVLGVAAPDFSRSLTVVTAIFLRLVRSIIGPLLFGALVSGIAGSAGASAMGRIGLKAVVYFQIITSISLLLGLAAANAFQPGAGLAMTAPGEVKLPEAALTFSGVVENAFPFSFVDALARGDILQIVVFSLLFGLACRAIGDKAAPVVRFCAGLAEVMFRYTDYVMYTAPFGVGAALAATIASKGAGALLELGKLVAAFHSGILVLLAGIFLPLILAARIPFDRFYRAVREPFLVAFSTASSGAALPIALENMSAFGVPRHVLNFVMPLGFVFNLAGSTFFIQLAVLFIAQTAGLHLSLEQQLLILMTLMLTTKGIAAVPRASLIVIAGTLTTFQIPMDGLAILLGVDALFDMVRTSVNLIGNCLAPALIARWERLPVTASPGTPAVLSVPEAPRTG